MATNESLSDADTTDQLVHVLRCAAADVRAAGRSIPGYAAATAEAADLLERHATDLTTVRARRDGQRLYRSRVVMRAVIVIAVLLSFLGGAFGGYRLALSEQREHLDAPLSQQAPIPVKPVYGTQRKACATLEASYPSLSAPLRAHGSAPTVVYPPEQFPNRTVHGEATDLAEILNLDLGPAYAHRPWPAWLQVFDNYVAALRAFSFVEVNAPNTATHQGIHALYEQALAQALQICHMKG
ncbi:hypothetical protein D2E64_22545 [Mycobacteroides abscessus]|uniref:hypothetical protein n=1 Tax=Mycobacteroides abscessus TaxID=36809 RepID=UPI0009291AF8|nr:hypothetical protein [Mycobacteroides abscessus]SIJ94513.1 Uncharacterised protein [Mycobacteroides abscessus subsp. abscessus]MBN7567194.1 hypothetical protein [Mycobacteroides abscessus subsp. massiliense]RIS01713.1 hypothetical protein D2E63_25120 [Mycobacteroides abscessus]RIS09153.1 hypothetical protein D2E69_25130 [Mycobacteroides abscessus]RIS21920.1 hypothetical protein D2E67_25150 [Mycobacteroides abscessus]